MRAVFISHFIVFFPGLVFKWKTIKMSLSKLQNKIYRTFRFSFSTSLFARKILPKKIFILAVQAQLLEFSHQYCIRCIILHSTILKSLKPFQEDHKRSIVLFIQCSSIKLLSPTSSTWHQCFPRCTTLSAMVFSSPLE